MQAKSVWISDETEKEKLVLRLLSISDGLIVGVELLRIAETLVSKVGKLNPLHHEFHGFFFVIFFPWKYLKNPSNLFILFAGAISHVIQ